MRPHGFAWMLVAALVLAALVLGVPWPLPLPVSAAQASPSVALPASAPAAPAQAQAVHEVHEVQIQDYRYSPAVLTIAVGSTVRWRNLEKRVSHSILFSGAQGFESERIFPGEHWQRRFDTPGSYVYSCGPHPEMTGRIDVVP